MCSNALKRLVALTILTMGVGAGASATVIYDEAINGDLSNMGLAPTFVTVAVGSNEIFGTTGRVGATDRDYLTFTVPVGFQLVSLIVLPGTMSGGVSFIGLQAGNQVTLPTNAQTAMGLLGWHHYSPIDINLDILDDMAIPNNGSSGFMPPLGAGSYALWIQDFNAGSFSYGFDLELAAAVPEPAAGASVMVGLGLLTILHRVKRR